MEKKRKEKELKIEKENEKEKRLRERAEKKAQKTKKESQINVPEKNAKATKECQKNDPENKPITAKDSGQTKKAEKLQDKCKICFTTRGGEWIMCDTCCRWFHQECISKILQNSMKAAIKENTQFNCHICVFEP